MALIYSDLTLTQPSQPDLCTAETWRQQFSYSRKSDLIYSDSSSNQEHTAKALMGLNIALFTVLNDSDDCS